MSEVQHDPEGDPAPESGSVAEARSEAAAAAPTDGAEATASTAADGLEVVADVAVEGPEEAGHEAPAEGSGAVSSSEGADDPGPQSSSGEADDPETEATEAAEASAAPEATEAAEASPPHGDQAAQGAGAGGGSKPEDEGEPTTRVCSVALEEFEGPLDLLLHLVRRHELDILDIPIAFVCEKYLEYIEFMRALDLEVAGDYLVMAATLAYLKSRELVPQQAEEVEEGEEEEGPDPRQQLIARLLEYQKYKDAASKLDARPISGRDTFGRGQDVELPPVDAGLAPITLFRLAEAYQRVLERARIHKSHEVVLETISVAARMEQLATLLIERSRFEFETLFLEREWSSEGELRSMLVVTLMSVLELVRMGIASVHQPLDSKVILVERVADEAQAREALASYDESISFGKPKREGAETAEGKQEPAEGDDDAGDADADESGDADADVETLGDVGISVGFGVAEDPRGVEAGSDEDARGVGSGDGDAVDVGSDDAVDADEDVRDVDSDDGDDAESGDVDAVDEDVRDAESDDGEGVDADARDADSERGEDTRGSDDAPVGEASGHSRSAPDELPEDDPTSLVADERPFEDDEHDEAGETEDALTWEGLLGAAAPAVDDALPSDAVDGGGLDVEADAHADLEPSDRDAPASVDSEGPADAREAPDESWRAAEAAGLGDEGVRGTELDETGEAVEDAGAAARSVVSESPPRDAEDVAGSEADGEEHGENGEAEAGEGAQGSGPGSADP